MSKNVFKTTLSHASNISKTFHRESEIEKTKLPENTNLASMDVTSLCTNIPQEESITTVCKAYEEFGSIFASGQPTSNHGNRPGYPYRLRLLINFDLSSSICGIRARKQSNTMFAYRVQLAHQPRIKNRARTLSSSIRTWGRSLFLGNRRRIMVIDLDIHIDFDY